MSKTNIFFSVLLLVIAVPSTFAFSAGSWYCYRLVPRSILLVLKLLETPVGRINLEATGGKTYAVTPCTYPCLLVSRHVHPEIVVQNEMDGTPCVVHTDLNHKREFGMCRSSVCTQELHHKVLKRRKRFIFLYAIPRVLQLRKESRKLKNKIEELQDQLARSRNRGMENEEEMLPGSGSGSFGVGSNGINNGERFGPEYDADVPSGTPNLEFAQGGGGINPAGSPGFGAGSDKGGESGASNYLRNGNSERGSLGIPGAGTDDDISSGQEKLG